MDQATSLRRTAEHLALTLRAFYDQQEIEATAADITRDVRRLNPSIPQEVAQAAVQAVR